MKYAVILGYGLFDDSKSRYARYLDAFTRFVNANAVDVAVFSGGHTSPERISISEAATMADHVRPLLKRNVKIVLEESSLSTAQNIEFSGRVVDTCKGNTIIVFCDNIRPAKVLWFVMHYWFDLSKREIERYFIGLSLVYYRKRYTTEQIGKEMKRGMAYKNVTIFPYPLRSGIDDAISQQIPTVLEIGALYDRRLYGELIRAVKVRQGLIRP